MSMISTSSKNFGAATFPGKRLSLRGLLSVWRSRRALANLDADGLRDVGISRSQAQLEAKRAPWDVPDTWIDR